MTLEAKSLSFQYKTGGIKILNEFDFHMESGERVGLNAPSGFGKTTLCKILAGYENPDSGEVLLDGAPLASYKGYCPVQMIWQHPEDAVNPKLRIRDIIAEGDTIDKRLIKSLEIDENWMERYPGELSGGELQRCCIARALGPKTRFILADEITAMLDMISQAHIWHFLLDEIKQRNIGLLMVSHSAPLIGRICDRSIKFVK